MSTRLANLSPSHLASLLLVPQPKDRIYIRWVAEADSTTSTLLFHSYPKKLATTFCGKWKKQFNPVVALATIEQLRRSGNNTVLVVGGDPEHFKQILRSMVSCCDGQGLKQFPKCRATDKPFCCYVWLW